MTCGDRLGPERKRSIKEKSGAQRICWQGLASFSICGAKRRAVAKLRKKERYCKEKRETEWFLGKAVKDVTRPAILPQVGGRK